MIKAVVKFCCFFALLTVSTFAVSSPFTASSVEHKFTDGLITTPGSVLIGKSHVQVILHGQAAQALFVQLGKNSRYEACRKSNSKSIEQFRTNTNGTLWCKADDSQKRVECRFSQSLSSGQILKQSKRLCVFQVPVLNSNQQGTLSLTFNNGSFADPAPANNESAALHLFLEGAVAEQLFKKIGPDQKPNPTLYPPETLPLDHRIRSRGRDFIFCRAYDDGKTACNLGIDVLRGKAKFAIGS